MSIYMHIYNVIHVTKHMKCPFLWLPFRPHFPAHLSSTLPPPLVWGGVWENEAALLLLSCSAALTVSSAIRSLRETTGEVAISDVRL